MSSIVGMVSSIVLALSTPSYAAAAPDDREAFVAGVSAAVAEATCLDGYSELVDCRPVWPPAQASQLAALLVTLARFESGLSPRIGFGHCRPDECDAVKLPGGRVLHLAFGWWQLHRTGLVSPDEWREARGRGWYPVSVQARIAVRVLVSSVGQCRGSGAPVLRAAISGFATGGRCWWGGAPARERVVLRVLDTRRKN